MRELGRKLFPYLVILLVVAATAWAFSTPRVPPADFTFVNGTEIESVDPGIVTGQPEGRIIWAIFEGLTKPDPETLEPRPGVAERWEISEDGKTYTFFLRPDARWSNGQPVTAHDFAYSYRRFLDPKSAGKYSPLLYYLKNGEKFSVRRLEAGDAVEVELHEKPKDALPFGPGRRMTGKLEEILTLDPESLTTVDVPEGEREGFETGYQVKIGNETNIFVIGDPPVAGAQYWAEDGNELRFVRDVLLDFDQVGVHALDDRTLRLTLTNRTPFFLSLTSFYPLSPVNRQCVETFGYPAWTAPERLVSNGAFLLKERRIRERIRLVKNPHYWNRDNVRLETIDALACESTTTMLNLYMTGQADWIPSVPSTIVSELIEQKRDDFRPAAELTVNFYRINVEEPPLDRPLVRRALAMAIDKRQIVETVTRAGEEPAESLVPPGLTGYERALGEPFNPERARQLLAEAGFPGGRGFPKIQILYNTEETHQLVAELIQHQWKDHLGIDAELQNQEWNVYLAMQSSGDYDVARAGWVGDYSDPNTFLEMFITDSPLNQTGWSNAKYDKLIAAAGEEADPERRLQILHEAEQLLLEEMPVIPLYFRVSKNMVRPYVHGFYPNIQDVHPLDAIWVDQPAKQRFLETKGLE